MPAYVEVWIEKDALAGVVYDITSKWDVPLMVTRGYPSLSYTYEAAEAIKIKRKPIYIYYLGDYDPSGIDISRTVEQRLREFAIGAEIYFERIAVTENQIYIWNLPTRPTKKTDTRAKNFISDTSVELDAIPPTDLRDLVELHILSHIDVEVYSNLTQIEKLERESMRWVNDNMKIKGESISITKELKEVLVGAFKDDC